MLQDPFILGILCSLGAGLMTGVGALPIFAGKHSSPITQDVLLGFGAGVMLSASFFSLIIPGLEFAETESWHTSSAASIVGLGIFLGSLLLYTLNRFLPHEHFIIGPEGSDAVALRRIWLFIIAITIHNFPEGLAVGVGFGGGNIGNGYALATGIGLQNLPEGLAVAMALFTLGYTKAQSFGLALMTGLAEPLGGLLGVLILSLGTFILPAAMGFAAGAMIYVISSEIIPETHRRGHQQASTWGLMLGMLIMFFLDVSLG